MMDRSLFLALSFSIAVHGLFALCFITTLKKTTGETLAPIEIVWEKKVPLSRPQFHKTSSKHRQEKVVSVPPLPSQKRKMSVKSIENSPFQSTDRKKNADIKSTAKRVTRTASHPLPAYPWICRKRKQEGVVMIQVKADANGHAQEVTLHKSSGHAALDKAALEALKSWVFAEDFPTKILSIAFHLKS